MSNKRSTKISPRFTELIDLSEFNIANLFFDTPQEMEIQQGNKTIKYFKLNIGNQTKAGVGEFVFNIPHFCHSFGIEEFQNEAGKATNHSVSLSLIDKNATSEEQEQQMNMVKKFTTIIDRIKDQLVACKKEIKKPTLDKNDLKTLNPMRQSVDEDGNPKDSAWYFSPKLMERKIYNKEDPSDVQIKIETQFFLEDQFDEKGDPVEISPLEFLGKKHFKFRGAIKLENVYIGSKISLQCKIYDGCVKTVSNERKRLTQFKRLGAASGSSSNDDEELLLDDE